MYSIAMVYRCYWITGLSASGKTTISKKLTNYIKNQNQNVILLDGDTLRKIFNHNNYDNFSRLEYGYIYARLCKLLISQKQNVVIAIGGLFYELHEWNRLNIPNYIEIFLDVPFYELEKRDPKGLYQNFKNGSIKNLNGKDISPQFPQNSNLHLKWKKDEDENTTFGYLKKYIESIK